MWGRVNQGPRAKRPGLSGVRHLAWEGCELQVRPETAWSGRRGSEGERRSPTGTGVSGGATTAYNQRGLRQQSGSKESEDASPGPKTLTLNAGLGPVRKDPGPRQGLRGKGHGG